MTYFPLAQVRVCGACDIVGDFRRCPLCDSEGSVVWLAWWLASRRDGESIEKWRAAFLRRTA